MRKLLWGVVFLATLLLNWVLPADTQAFALNATNFSGYAAWDKQGDVIGEFGLDPRLSYENTGQYFNTAIGLMFDFEYLPTYPTVADIVENPTTDWMWTFYARNLCLPGHGPLPELTFSHKASYTDILSGVNWLEESIGPFIPEDLCYIFDYEMYSPTTGSAYLAVAGNSPLCWLPPEFPDQGFCDFACDAEIGVTAEPIPEPVSIVLFGVGLAGIAAFRRKRQ